MARPLPDGPRDYLFGLLSEADRFLADFAEVLLLEHPDPELRASFRQRLGGRFRGDYYFPHGLGPYFDMPARAEDPDHAIKHLVAGLGLQCQYQHGELTFIVMQVKRLRNEILAKIDALSHPVPEPEWIICSQADVANSLGVSPNTARLIPTLIDRGQLVAERISGNKWRVAFKDPASQEALHRAVTGRNRRKS